MFNHPASGERMKAVFIWAAAVHTFVALISLIAPDPSVALGFNTAAAVLAGAFAYLSPD